MVATTVTSIFLNQDDRVPDDSRGKLFLVESRFLEKKSVSEIYQTPDLKKLRNFKKTGENLVGSRFFGLPNAPVVSVLFRYPSQVPLGGTVPLRSLVILRALSFERPALGQARS